MGSEMCIRDRRGVACEGEGETGGWRVPGRFPVGRAKRRRDGRARPARARNAGRKKKKSLLCYTRLQFREWDVSRGVTHAGMPQGKVVNRHPAILVARGSFLKNATFRDKLALCHFFFKHVFWLRITTPFCLDFVKSFLTSSRFVINITSIYCSRFLRKRHVS